MMLRDRRESRGWSKLRLAEEADVNWRTIDNLEHGRGAPTIATLFRVAEALQCELWIEMEQQ